ncbi:hypothetical protein [Streptomyces sp. NRRL F-2747]|uniref:hypothetical protein n=1 Tax=Streptomyces sp. NRRL F-2747 TaxID=1463843 RepID=UPI000AD1D37E|nr:hypothetical protein [Streptomyces sp. NRRL F-2747]
MTVIDALAALLASPLLTATELHDDPEAVRARFGLSEEELELLAGVPDDAYDRVARDVAAKHRLVVAQAMPDTVTEVTARHRNVLEGYLTGSARLPHPDDPVGAELAAEAFLEHAAGRIPAGLAEFGRFELARFRLRRDEIASDAARYWHETGPRQQRELGEAWIDYGVPVVPATVLVVSYGHDVTAPDAPARIPEAPVTVALQRVWREPVRAFRLEPGTRDLLALCDGTRTALRAAAEAGAHPAQAGAALVAMARAGLLVPRGGPDR